ncbi:MAG: hypothetical protein R3E66_08895 [bacterium]
MHTPKSVLLVLLMAACGDDGRSVVDVPPTDFGDDAPAAGWMGGYPVPPEAAPADTSSPDHVVGDGTAASCTQEVLQQALTAGGTIVFDCGPDPVTIALDQPLRIRNDADPDIVVDGAGKVTLSGQNRTRILYMNTCDESLTWTTSHCDNQDHPRLTLQNLTFVDGDSRGEDPYDGGGAIWVRGGRLKVVNSRFFHNRCKEQGPDVGGGAIRATSQYDGLPVYVVNSTFGGAQELGNTCANGGALSSIGVSWSIYNSLFSHNAAVGNGGNPAQDGTPGGGSGGAIYNDGNFMRLAVYGSMIRDNRVNAHGAAIFFVSNDHSGELEIRDSTLRDNTGGSWYALPGISMHDDTAHTVEGSTLE